MNKLENQEKKSKKLEIKPAKELAKAVKAIKRMREIFKEAGFSPYKEYMKNKHAR